MLEKFRVKKSKNVVLKKFRVKKSKHFVLKKFRDKKIKKNVLKKLKTLIIFICRKDGPASTFIAVSFDSDSDTNSDEFDRNHNNRST